MDTNGHVFTAGYLAAKREIDDRALNTHVLDTLTACLSAENRAGPPRVLEVGAGIGSMCARLVERGLFTGTVEYWLTDTDQSLLAEARNYLTGWAGKHNFSITWNPDHTAHLTAGATEITISLAPVDIRYISSRPDFYRYFDLLIAHGVLDLFELSPVVEELTGCLGSGGLCYFTCNFDGETYFSPELPDDRRILDHYHGSMAKRSSTARYTGRRLLGYFLENHAQVMAAGSSDWVIHPGSQGYSAAQREFLGALISLVEKEVADIEENRRLYTTWIDLRRQQIDAGSLSLVAKHLDILARPDPGTRQMTRRA
jgi:SAM-dependent methyltransferase